MRIPLLAALTVVLLAPAALAQTPTAPPVVITSSPSPLLTLDDAIGLARRNNPAYLQQTTARRTADASVRSARGALLPSADANFGTRY